jgi:Fur family ferric uptake transcriptional regulator
VDLTKTVSTEDSRAIENEVQPVTAEGVLALFEQLGLRSTRPRRLIARRLARLASAGRDFATEDLWKALQADEPGIGRATVYRAVEVLAREGVLDRVPFADGTHRYRVCGTNRHHHHVTCVRCQRVVEVDTCLPDEVLEAIERSTHYAIEGHALELFGRCDLCREVPAGGSVAL